MSKIVSESLKKHNATLNLLKYHVKKAKDEDERLIVQNEINTLKLIYNINTAIDKFEGNIERIDEKYKNELETIIERLRSKI